jgi:hypothetical protein
MVKRKRDDDDEEDLHCTAPRCRQWVNAGQGNQWVNEKGDTERYCVRCWTKKNKDEEKRDEPRQ